MTVNYSEDEDTTLSSTQEAQDEFSSSSEASTSEVPSQEDPTDPSIEALRDILFSRYRRQIAELESELDDLERRISDRDAFASMLAPAIGDAIRRKIRDAREEMTEALYPIIGQTITRAVSEAIQDLARTIDAHRRAAFNPQLIGQRLRARVGGASSAEAILRESLPFDVTEVFLIHRETGLLLWHVSQDEEASPDSDIISGMLTAIRDFVRMPLGKAKKAI